jgi:hypothetical protein
MNDGINVWLWQDEGGGGVVVLPVFILRLLPVERDKTTKIAIHCRPVGHATRVLSHLHISTPASSPGRRI